MIKFCRFLGFFCALFVCIVQLPVRAQEEAAEEEELVIPKDDFEREKLFALTLVKWGLPDYAQIVKDNLATQFPNQKENLLLIQANINFQLKKYTEVEELLKQLPPTNSKAQAIRLRMAAYVLADGEREKAAKIIQGFFDQIKNEIPQDPDLKEQYISAAFLLSDIYKIEGNPAEAVKILEKMPKVKPSRIFLRKADSDRAYALLRVAEKQSGDARKKTLAEVGKIADALQWVSDPYKGHGLVAMAMARKLQGDKAGALKFLQDYSADLKGIDEAMTQQGMAIDNPLAAARLFMGQINEEEGRAAFAAGKKDDAKKRFGAALTEYFNVFRKYTKDISGRQAGLQYDDLAAYIRKEGLGDPKPIAGPTALGGSSAANEGAIVMAIFNLAEELRKSGRTDEAIAKYLEVLNKYPETSRTSQILRNLLSCYEKNKDSLMVEVVATYAAERFSQKEEMVAIAHLAAVNLIKADNAPVGTNILARILQDAPEYKHNCGLRYTYAQYLARDKRDSEAIEQFQRVVDHCKGDAVALKALTSLSSIAYTAGKYDIAASNLVHLIQSTPEGIEKAEAKTRLANCYLMLQKTDSALELLRGLLDELKPRPNSPYYAASAKGRGEGLLQTNTFFYAATLSKLEPGTAGVKDPVEEAIKIYESFIEKNPKNEQMTPTALFSKGRLLIQQNKFDEAVRAFERLASDFPGTEQGKSAMYAGVKAAVEAGKTDVARQFVQKMLGNRKAYGPNEFLIVGTFMAESGLFAESEECLKTVLEHPGTQKDEDLHQLALYGLALAANRQAEAENTDAARMDTAIQAINTLTNQFPKTGKLMDAALLQASNYRMKKDFDNASLSLNLVFENAYRLGDKRAEVEANLELARIQADRGESLPAFASILRIVLTANYKDEKLRDTYRKAILRGLEAGSKLEPSRPKDMRTLCDRFLEHYPGDPETLRVQEIRKNAIVEMGG